MTAVTPLVLHSGQFAGVDHPSHSDQCGNDCDCACPDNGFILSAISNEQDVLLQQPALHSQSLPPKHTLLFNPLRDGHIAVVNEAALNILQAFQEPQSLSSLSTTTGFHVAPILEEMTTLGLLQPVGNKPLLYQGQPQTLSAWLHVTNECNLRCAYCYISKTAQSMTPEVGNAAIDAIMRSARQGGFQKVKLKFAGGEATLNLKLVLSLHEYARKKTAEAGIMLDAVILTNGVAIGEREITACREQGIRFTISLDGIGETHDAQRQFVNGRGSFAWVNRSIERLVARGIQPFITITVSNRNLDGLPDVVNYVLDRDLPFNLNFYRENDCSTPHTDLSLQDDRLIEKLDQVFEVIENKLPRRSLLGSLVDRAQFDRPHNKPCGVNESYLVIDHYGRVAQCHMEIEKTITDVFADDPLALLKSDSIHVQNIPVEEKEGCRECEWRYWCAGGCPLLTYRATGRYDIKSPYCRVYKAVYPRLLRLEGLRLLKLYREEKGLPA